ncbi:MAG: O-antigen ligase family protein [Pseudomonadota bacterium]
MKVLRPSLAGLSNQRDSLIYFATFLALFPFCMALILDPQRIMVSEPTKFRLIAVFTIELLFFIAVLKRTDWLQTAFQLPHKAVTAIIACVLIIAFSRVVFVPENASLTILRTTAWIGHILFGFALYSVLIQRSANTLAHFMLLSVPAAAFAYVALISAQWIINGPPTGEYCALFQPVFLNIRYTGGITAVAAALLTFYAINVAKGPNAKLCLTVGAIFLWAFLSYSGARGGFIAVSAALIFMLVVARSKENMRLVAASAGIIVLGSLLPLLLPTPECGNFGIWERFASKLASDDVSSGRIEIWYAVLSLIEGRPFFGHGEIILFERFAHFQIAQSHNLVLQFALTWGVVGAVLVCGLIAALILRTSLKLSSLEPMARATLFAFLTGLGYAMMDATPVYYDYHVMIMVILAVALCAMLARSNAKTFQPAAKAITPSATN